MKQRAILIVAGVLILIGLIAAGWYLASPLFFDQTVDEPFPFEVPDETAVSAMSPAERAALEQQFMAAVPDAQTVAAMPDLQRQTVEDAVMEAAAMVMMDKEIADAMMPEEWTAVARGQFSGADSFHQGAGSATILQKGEQRVLRFEDFSVTNGPDLHVVLSGNPAPSGLEDIGEDHIDLGKLSGNMGDQNYEIDADVDLANYRSVVIYCQPFHVVFATAPLTP